MSNCGCGHVVGSGPYAEGRELVVFVAQAHGGSLRERSIPNGGLEVFCGGCSAPFVLTTFVGRCPICEGVHAVSPPRADDPVNVQFAGEGFVLAEL
ncbi:hypothetical protein SAMN02745165_00890 [Malonomonas rubra DSM 5091]|uniref:Uncharacterized protein n=1 Tax=Malonomonas rubra DSM 5091 TaxID=1122189 RepID=A0A1M6E121_MALRU|nr:hypothetical protein [Malonomonas rubra]SHI79103.1 hypothetical protein SAMN02745165_00890 [Malonomonas rubra DSM 5091]